MGLVMVLQRGQKWNGRRGGGVGEGGGIRERGRDSFDRGPAVPHALHTDRLQTLIENFQPIRRTAIRFVISHPPLSPPPLTLSRWRRYL